MWGSEVSPHLITEISGLQKPKTWPFFKDDNIYLLKLIPEDYYFSVVCVCSAQGREIWLRAVVQHKLDLTAAHLSKCTPSTDCVASEMKRTPFLIVLA